MLPCIIACLVAGYLLGNLNGAILISRWVRKDDVRKRGSGNAGLTNFYRIYGGFDTVLVLLIDVGKTVLACFIGGWLLGAVDPALTQTGNMICGCMAVVGHVYPALFRFHGGKGVLACGALAAFMDWRAFVICIGLFLLIVLLTRYVSLGSILACALYPFMFWWRFPQNWAVIVMAFVAAGLAIFMHRSNIVRLLRKQESKFSFRRKGAKP